MKKTRSGPKIGKECKKGGGIAGSQGDLINVNYKIPGAGESEGYDQVVTRRSGANK